MRRVFGAIVVTAALLGAAPASAQQADDNVPRGPIVNSWYAGANTGVAVVEKFGGVLGAEAGIRLWRNLDGVVDVFWTPNIATRRQLDGVDRLVEVLRASGDASGRLKAPVIYTGVGARWVFENSGRFRPYVLFTIGSARIEKKASFSVNGSDVSGSLPTYGITLGQDLAGTYSRLGTEGGVGILMGYGTWYFDAGARLLSVDALDQRTNVARVVLGGGYRF